MTALAAPPVSRIPRSRPVAPAATRPNGGTRAAPKLRYIVVTLAGIFAILGGQLLLSISVSSGAYEISSLKGDMRNSQQSLQIVAEEIGALTAPDTLASLAGSMGMVEDNNPAYLRVSDGAVLGEAVPAASTSGATVYPVTAGTENYAPAPIVTDVTTALSAQALAEVGAEEATLAVVTPAGEADERVIQPAIAVAATPTVTFGGSIPSPVTR